MKNKLITIILLGIGVLFAAIPVSADDEFPELGAFMPGAIVGTGTYFEIKDSEYLNVILQSSEEITVSLESIPKVVSLTSEASTLNSFVTLAIGGLEPNSTYYKYEDSFKNEAVFNCDENGNYSWVQDLTQSHRVWFQEEKGTTFIPDRCSDYGVWDDDGFTCTLTRDIAGSLEITQSNIVLDCNNHSIMGTGASYSAGIFLRQKTGVTIKNCNVESFSTGILLSDSQSNELRGNNISTTFQGIRLDSHSSNNFLIGNSSLNNDTYGIMLSYGSNNNILRTNSMHDNKYNFGVWGFEASDYIQSIDTSNTVDGKPIYYLVDEQDSVIDASSNAGYVGIVNSQDIEVRDLVLENNFQGVVVSNTQDLIIDSLTLSNNFHSIYLHSVSNTTTTHNNIAGGLNGYGISVHLSDHNSISHNTTTQNGGGIGLSSASYTDITGNTMSFNSPGIYMSGVSSSTISGNQILSNNSYGVELISSYNNLVSDNTIVDNKYGGIRLSGSYDNIIIENTIAENKSYASFGYGIDFTHALSANNEIYHNNFIDNYYKPQVRVLASAGQNSFDDGYLSGGNYWSDYDSVAEGCLDKKGDGFCDAPYTFTGGEDNYPFVTESGWGMPPIISNLGQFKSDEVSPIAEGDTTTESTIVFKSFLSDPDDDQVKLQVELKEYNQSFNEQDLLESDFVDSNSTATITRYGLIDGQYHWQVRAVDLQGAVSEDWQEFGELGNVDFEVKLVPLYTQIESPYPSEVETRIWSRLPYGSGNYKNCFDEELKYSAIRNCGCVITSEVMILRFHDVITTADDIDVNPQTFNEWLTNNNGYWPGGDVKWEKIQEYSKDKDGFARVIYDGIMDYKDNTTLDLYLDDLHPVILSQEVLLQGELTSHFIVADGKLVTTYTIKDSAWYDTKKLTQAIGSYARDYNNNFYGLRLFRPVLALYGVDSLSFNLASPAEILVTDPQDQKLGKDPITDIEYSEIAGGSYYQEGIGNPFPGVPTPTEESKFIWIPDPLDGKYNIQVIGTDVGSYTLSLSAYDQNGQSKDIEQQGDIITDAIQEFELDYSLDAIEETEFHQIVEIDIKPGSYPNSINCKNQKGIITVAILTTEIFDATNIDSETIHFGPDGAQEIHRDKHGKAKTHLEDLDEDDDLDAVFHFRFEDTGIQCGDQEAILTGKTLNGFDVSGLDSIRTVGGSIKKSFFPQISLLLANLSKLLSRLLELLQI